MKAVTTYSVTATVVVLLGFVALNAGVPSTGESSQALLPVPPFLGTMALMFCAGAMGGCLYNFRGLIKHSQNADFDERYALTYYLRPLSAGVCGLMVFFLLLGGALTLSVGNQGQASWQSQVGRMPYVALSLLAGYGSQEFMMKLKDLADTLFALKHDRKDPET